MVQAYNFLASWQLFPEKCIYEKGLAPKAGNYKIDSIDNGRALSIQINFTTIENQAYYAQYECLPDNNLHAFNSLELADQLQAEIIDKSTIEIRFFKLEQLVLLVRKEILSNGYLKIIQQFFTAEGSYTNTDIYHKQLMVLPYAASVGSVAVRPTEAGVIKHKALQAMEEQTNMHLMQIREQIEVLARQAQEISKRKELSMLIYDARLSFQPVIGHRYYLYQKQDDSHFLSMISPAEWGGSGPFKSFLSAVQLLADHTWMEIKEQPKKH